MFRVAFFKGTHPGLPGVYNWAVRQWSKSAYSHCELIFKDGMSASSSFLDKGVRFKEVVYNDVEWDFIVLPDCMEDAARAWFVKHEHEPYDLKGNFHFVFGAVGDDRGKSFCSEAVAAALGIVCADAYQPGTLASTLKRLSELYFNEMPQVA